MDFLLGVEIDNSRVVWIYNSTQAAAKTIRLTTVAENQQKADIKFYIKQSGKKTLLCTERISNLPPMKAGEPSIDIKPRISNKTFFYEIYVNGQLSIRSSQSFRKYLRTKRPFIITAAILTALILAALAIFLISPVFNRMNDKPEVIIESAPVTEKTTEPELQPEPLIDEDVISAESKEESEPQVNEIVFVESEITDRYSVYFQPESSELTPEAISGLNIFINKLPKENDFEEAQFELEIRGHCARYGSEEGRSELSKERASTVYYYLKSGWGIEADSFVTGAGASEPVSLKRDEQHLNRRVDINIKGNIKKREMSN